MTKADIVNRISDKTGIEKADVQAVVENFMIEIKRSLENGENVYLRGFGSFIIKKRAQKTGRNIPRIQLSLFLHIIYHILNLQKNLLKQ